MGANRKFVERSRTKRTCVFISTVLEGRFFSGLGLYTWGFTIVPVGYLHCLIDTEN